MLSELFCVSVKGETIFHKKYRFDVHKDTTEVFVKRILDTKSPQLLPLIKDDDVNYYHIKRNNMYFVATSKASPAPILVIEILTRFHHICKDFCGIITEDSLKTNTILVYELLDEFMDNGYVQLSSTDKLKPYIQSDPVHIRATKTHDNMTSGLFGVEYRAPVPSDAADLPVIRSRQDQEQRKNEIFVDVIERITALIDSNGELIRCNISGKVNMKCFLYTSSPTIRLALNEDLVIEESGQHFGYGGVHLNSFSLHQCVDDSDFIADRELKINPPDGEFAVLEYTQQDDSHHSAPFRLMYTTSDPTDRNREVEITLKLRCNVPDNSEAINISAKIPLPKNVSNVLPLMKGTNQKLEFIQTDKYVHWTLKNLRGGGEAVCKFKVTNTTHRSSPMNIGPLALDFEISGHVTSGLRIRYLRIADQSDQSRVLHRWIRYITVPDSYIIRM